MSSVGRSGSDDIQAVKIKYETRAAQKDKAHEAEIKELKENHEKELAKVSNEAKEQYDQQRTRAEAKYTEQDMKHQKDIEALKAMYQKKLAERD